MDFEQLLDRLYMMDFEVTKFDWLLVIKKYRTKERTVFHNASADEIQTFISNNNPIFIGHNLRYYDQYILKAILAGFDITEIKNVNDHIINGGQGFEIDYGYVKIPPCWDTLQDVVPAKSLKEIEANLCMDITESTVDFNIDHKWTKQEYKEMLYYCDKDVDALFPLFEARYDYFKTKYDLCVMSDIDPAVNVGLTNAKLCAKFLEATPQVWNDERDITIPDFIDLDLIDKGALEYYLKILDKTIPDDVYFKMKYEYDLHGMPTVASQGGKHGAKRNYTYEETDNKTTIINCDFESLYPHLQALPQYNYISRNCKDKQKYANTLAERLRLKHEGKKKEQVPRKLILNTTYGAGNDKWNPLYDPKGAHNTCIVGQLLISELTERLYRIGDVELIQVNTDGTMIAIPTDKLPMYYDICSNFIKKCGINLEYDIIHKIVQRDVNNYLMLYGDKNALKIKAKGGCFSALPDIKINEDGSLETKYKPNFQKNSLAIVSEALAKYLLFDISIEETINNETNIWKFQTVQHLGSTYQKCVQESPNGDIVLQKNNRIYAGKKPSGKIIKVKYDGRRDSLSNCPTNPIVDNANKCTIDDINKDWYIRLAKQWANDFKGVKRLENYKKEELLQKANELGLDVDKKTKKADLVTLVQEELERRETQLPNKTPHANENTRRYEDLTNKRYGKSVVISFNHTDKKHTYWNCQCDCGNIFMKRADQIKTAVINNCGKCHIRKNIQHCKSNGDTSASSEYRYLYGVWKGMRQRCQLPSIKYYHRYGNRGIKVCDDWNSNYLNFKEWALNNGYKHGLSIDRIDNDGDYCPQNCRWVNSYTQMSNTSVSWRIPYRGATYCISGLARKLGIPRTTLRRYLIKNSMDVDKCIKEYEERRRENE